MSNDRWYMHYTDSVLRRILGSLGVKYKECGSHVCGLADKLTMNLEEPAVYILWVEE